MAFTASCAVSPEPISEQDHLARSRADLDVIHAVEFVPEGPITLHEAMARAVAFNLKSRVAQIERGIAEAELEHSNYDMLPTLDLKAGRDRADVKVSPSDDRISKTGNASFTWNLLDLGVSYARAKQRADEVLIAKEKERKAVQDIIRQVNTAFWRAATGQRLMVRVHSLARDLQLAMKASHRMERTRATDVLSAVAFRREIVASVRQALSVRRELREAKAELAELLNIRPGVDFTLSLPADGAPPPRLPMSLPDMETHALQNRPELRIEDYNERISEWRAREALYGMLPGLDLTVAQNYSSESTNLSPNWLSAGLHLGMNLFNLFSGSSEMETAERQGELARRQRLAMSLAVLTQLHIAHIRYRNAAQQMRLATEIADSDRRLTRLVRTDGNFLRHDFFEAVRIATRQLQSELEEQRSYVDLVSAHADVMHSIGLDVVPEPVPVNDIPALTAAIRAVTGGWKAREGGIEEAPTASPIDRLVSGMLSPPRARVAAVPRPAPAEAVRQLAEITPASGSREANLRAAAPDWELSPAAAFRGHLTPAARDTGPAPARAYVVTLGAFRDQDNALRLHAALSAGSREALGRIKLRINLRPGGTGPTYYYVETASIADRGQAQALCHTLKAAGRPCFVTLDRN
jgi:outer membrane protein TolC